MFMESWIIRVSGKVNMKPKETQSIHDSMNIPKIKSIIIAYIYILSLISKI